MVRAERGRKATSRLERIVGVWASAGIACMLSGLVSAIKHARPFGNVSYVALMIAIGCVAHAVQTTPTKPDGSTSVAANDERP